MQLTRLLSTVYGRVSILSPLYLLSVVLAIPFFRTRLSITSPFGFVSAFVGFMFVCKYLYNYYLGVPFLEWADPQELLTHLYPMAAYLLIAFSLALPFCNPRPTAAPHDNSIDRSGQFELSLPGLLTLIALPFLLVSLALSRGLNPLYNPLAFRQFIQSQGMFYLLSVYIFLMSAVSIFVPYTTIVRRHRPSLLSVIAYLVSAAFAITSGFASMIIIMITIPLYFWSVCYRTRIELGMVVLLPLVVAFTLFYSAYRDANLSGLGISPAQAFQTVAENPEAARRAFNRFDYLENFAKANRYLNDQDPDWGSSILGVLVQPIPRAFWPQKPENFSTSMTRVLLPENLDIGVTANFNSLNEFVEAFGSFGILVGGVVLALILSISYAVFDSAAGRPYLAAYYVLVLFQFVCTGFFAGYFNDLALPNFILDNIFFGLFIRRKVLHDVTPIDLRRSPSDERVPSQA